MSSSVGASVGIAANCASESGSLLGRSPLFVRRWLFGKHSTQSARQNRTTYPELSHETSASRALASRPRSAWKLAIESAVSREQYASQQTPIHLIDIHLREYEASDAGGFFDETAARRFAQACRILGYFCFGHGLAGRDKRVHVALVY